MADIYLVGQVARISWTLTDPDGAPVDPGSLILKTRLAAGAVSTLAFGIDAAIVRDGTGRYHADLPLTAAGRLYYRLEAGAANAGADEGCIVVAAGRF